MSSSQPAAWGGSFVQLSKPSARAYAYNFAHTNDSITVILRELRGRGRSAQAQRGPLPNHGAANAVTDQIAYLTSLLHQQPVGDTEGAAYAAQSDSESSASKTRPRHTQQRQTHNNKPFYVAISNAYSTLPQCAADPPISSIPTHILSLPPPVPIPSTFKLKAMRRLHARQHKRAQTTADNQLLDQHITWAEGERTAAAKADILHPRCQAINNAHTRTSKPAVSLLQASKNTGYALATNIRRTLHKCLPAVPHVTFQAQARVRHFHPNTSEPMITYDSGADGHYLSEADRHTAKLPILAPPPSESV
eukprot:CCRYP_018080-RA/>CCRYP_018080-RA protein AED:0.62 eAED:0.39 QI:0/0/0/0.5/1/1/2/0/305